jgi:hypothetical protein
MDEQVQRALAQGGVIDITTRGRHTGQPRRIEIRFHAIEGQVYITGRPPRRRAWYANLLTHPEFTFHLKERIQADLPARATPILDQARRRALPLDGFGRRPLRSRRPDMVCTPYLVR